MINFAKLTEHLGNRLLEPLPGQQAHQQLRAIPVGAKIPRFAHKAPPKPGSVLILLYPHRDQILFPLIKRPNYAGAHSGQVSFPGGKAEEGEDAIETALREGNEEIGISKKEITVLGTLSDFFVIPSNFKVTPILAYANQQPALVADPVEVARILHGDLVSILPDHAVRQKEITAANIYQMNAPHFEIENEVVWGATAMILNELRTIVKEILK